MQNNSINNNYLKLEKQPKLSKPTNKEIQNFNKLIDFKEKKINFGNSDSIQYINIELADSNEDGVFSDGEHLRIQTNSNEVLYIHNVKNKENIETIKNNFTQKYDAEYTNSTNGTKPNYNDFLIFTKRKTNIQEVDNKKEITPVSTVKDKNKITAPVPEVVEKQTLKEKLKYPKELTSNEHFNQYIKGLEEFEAELKKSLNLSDEDYTKLAQFSLAIIEAETDSGKNKKHFQRFKLPVRTPSCGISNIKMGEHQNLYSKFKEFGITTDAVRTNIIKDDKLAAAATIIVLDKHSHAFETYKNTCEEKNIPKDRILNKKEYIAARWKGFLVIDKRENKDEERKAKSNVDAFLEFRKNPNKKVRKKSACYILQIDSKYTEIKK